VGFSGLRPRLPMDLEPDSSRESLLHEDEVEDRQERTAYHTRRYLVAARLAFIFSHGVLLVSASVALRWEASASWWLVFTPVWLGDAVCAAFIVSSWFASCPYVQLCLGKGEARSGDYNPSILTEVMPDVVLSFLGFFALGFFFAAELLFCGFLSRVQNGEPRTLVPSAVVFIIASGLAFCRGVLIQAQGALFLCFGGAGIASSAAALALSGVRPLDTRGWPILLPWCLAVAGVWVAAARSFWRSRCVLNREERLLRSIEQVLLFTVLATAVQAIAVLTLGWGEWGRQAALGATSAIGAGTCILSLLRARMAILETTMGSVEERMIASMASARGMLGPITRAI